MNRLRMDKQIWLGFAILLGLGIATYFVYFHRPPTADILANNKKRKFSPGQHHQQSQGKHGEAAAAAGEDYVYYSDDQYDTPAVETRLIWEEWIELMGFVSIGVLYNTCEVSDDQLMLGQTVMLPDKILGGVTSRTYLNLTLDEDVTSGLMYLECQYNSKELYSNHWDLCTVEDGMDDKVIFCPIQAGKHKYIKNLKIPNYLPKGKYTVKAYLTNQDEKTIGCAYAEFTL